MTVLVVYGSKRRGTEGIAEIVGTALREDGLAVDVIPANRYRNIDGYDAVIVGSGLYGGRWHRRSARFVKKHTDELARLPVWFFSSGPLDDSAHTSHIPPVPEVEALMTRIGARGHVTFGGRLAAKSRGFSTAAAKGRAGDWREPGQIVHWARTVGRELVAPGTERADNPLVT
jgi:menaquinone-dependent protoporphyrinogen oxidase